MIGKIQRVKLREVWEHEALDFTTWLEENVDVLNDALDLPHVVVDREQSAGDFNVDLVAEDSAGNVVIIENQLERDGQLRPTLGRRFNPRPRVGGDHDRITNITETIMFQSAPPCRGR